METFHTDRLVATHVCESDYADLCAMHRDPTTMATLGGVRSDAVTLKFLHEKMAHWDTYGHGMWIFRDKQDGKFVGRALLEHIDVGGNPEVEVGYSVVAAQWGQGLATEMARAIVTIAFTCLSVDSIVSFTHPANHASRRVMAKAGFTYERAIVHVGEPHVLYRLKREQYNGPTEIRLLDGIYMIDQEQSSPARRWIEYRSSDD